MLKYLEYSDIISNIGYNLKFLHMKKVEDDYPTTTMPDGPEQIELSDEAKKELYSSAINTVLETEMAFKLFVHGLATRDMFMQRLIDLSDYLTTLYAKLKNFEKESETD